MIEKFKDKVCVVTGAGSGIGRALAIRLAGAGAALAISDINAEGLEETAQMIGKGSNRIRKDVLDVSDAAAIEPYAAAVKESLGSADYVFNVAGLARIGTFKDTPLDSFEKVMNVNFWGVVRMTKAFLPQLIETKGGVVNISSLFGLIGVPGQAHYCASKFGVRGFSETIAQELADKGVRVTSVHPGGVDTGIEEIASYFERHTALNGQPPDSWASAVTYASLQMLQQAIERKGLDRDAVSQELSSGEFDTILGMIRMEDNQLRTLWWTGQWQDGKFVATAPADRDGAGEAVIPKPAWK